MYSSKRFTDHFWIVFSFLLLSTGCREKETKKLGTTLLPYPQEIKYHEGTSFSPGEIKTIYLYKNADKSDEFAAHLLQEQVERLFGNQPEVREVDSYKNLAKPAILLGLPSKDKMFSGFCASIKLPVPKAGTEESYVLDIKNKLITISGGGAAGLFYGIQTMDQLLENARWEKQALQGQLIEDWPDIKLRWVHFDEKHHLDRYNYLKKAIARLARYKVNGVVFELEDKFAYHSHPVIAAPHSLTPRQVKELTAYAHQYHIDIIPLVQGLGHAGYILKHPEFKALRADPASDWAFNPLKEGTYDLLFDLYRETIKATPGVKYFHVGGDEVRFTGNNPQLQSYKKEHGEFSLYLKWLNRVHDFLKKQDRTMIFWDDMPLKIAGIWKLMGQTQISGRKFDSLWKAGTEKLDKVIDKFPSDAVYMQWTYSKAGEGNARLIDWFKKHRIADMSATAIQNSRPLIPDYSKKPANIKSFIALSARKHVSGELCTAWDDSGLHFATFWMGFLASAEYGWTHESPDSIRQYWDKYLYRFFGPDTKGLYTAFHNLSKRVHFWNTAVMRKGTKRTFRKDRLIALPSMKEPPEGSWSDHFHTLMEKANEEKKKNAAAVKVLEKNMDRVKRNAYNLEVFASMGRFMEADAELVLSIGKMARYADKAAEANKNGDTGEVVSDLNEMATVADSAWEAYQTSYDKLKTVWQISRYPKGGKGFVPDRYHHFASRREDLSYLIMPEAEMDLPGYAQKLRALAHSYEKK